MRDAPLPEWARALLDFWFAHGEQEWWRGPESFDQEVKARFFETWEAERQREAGAFLDSAELALAAVLLFDQAPRNMFRGHAEQFATDHLALAIAREAVARGFDDGLSKDQRTFLYMPFQHSEALPDQVQALLLFSALGDARLLDFARKHHDIIARFGRFPHRNKLLGRKPTAMELAAGDVVPW
ncbi:MAG: DUF924 family protein [Sphingosinicella sp.]